MYICLFSYNRGQYLDNCIQSIERCAPQAQLIIFDDHSNDAHTLDVLEKHRAKYTVIQPDQSKVTAGKFGGLYNNMQDAIDYFSGDELVLFIQDDMQMVREIDADDVADIDAFFANNPKAAFLHPAFLRGSNRARDVQTTQWHEESGCYYRHNAKQSAGVGFSAIFFTRVKRLHDAHWHFEPKEKINDGHAQAQFGKMGFMAHPVCAWLPNVPVYRGKTKTLALKIAEKARQCGYYPFSIMSPAQSAAFKQRGLDHLPVAEDYLELMSGELTKPWVYYGLEGRGGLKLLNRVEVRLRGLLAR